MSYKPRRGRSFHASLSGLSPYCADSKKGDRTSSRSPLSVRDPRAALALARIRFVDVDADVRPGGGREPRERISAWQ